VTQTRNERLVAGGLVLAALLTLVVGVWGYRTTAALRSAAEWVAHTRQVQSDLSDLLSAMHEVEAGQRGFVITGNPHFLEHRGAASEAVATWLADLRSLTADNPQQQAWVADLEDLTARKMAFSEHVLELRNQEGFAAAAALINTEEGRALMDRIQTLIDTMQDEENRLLEVRSAALRASQHSAALLLLGFVVLALGLLLGVYTVLRRDLRERVRAEANLRGLLESAPDATLVVDASGRIVIVNAQVPSLFGYTREELLGQPVERLMPARFREIHTHHRTAFLEDARTRPMGADLRLSAVSKEGDEFPVEISLSPLHTETGTWVTASVRDITERERAAEALRQAAEQIRDLYNRAPCGYHSLNPEGTFVEINDTELSWLGRRREEVVERLKFTEVLTPQSAARFEREYPLFKQRGWARDLEFEYVRSDGTILPVLLNATAITDAAGQYVMSRSMVIDMRERKRAEHLLIERETLDRTNRELQEFAYVASHDLQEPLRKIQAFGDRVVTKCAAVLPEDAKDYLTRMQKAAARMQTLINDLLSFSRVTTHARPFGPVDLNAIARDVISDLEGRIEQTRGRIEVSPLPTIDADATQMRQLLQNLLGNALKFHRAGVPPVVHVSSQVTNGKGQTPPPPPDEPMCELVVTDDGIGFDEKYLDRIFTIFQRLHGHDEYEGTGLGLAICRKIVERHHGHITARSTPGQGASFVITLPVRQSADASAAEEECRA